METIALSARASLSKWSCEDVGDWLKEQGFSKYSELFSNEHCIDGPALLALSEDDLKQPPIKLTVLGDIKRLMSKINELRANDPDYVNSNGIDVINLIKSQQNSNRYPHSTTITTMSINHLTSSSPMQNNAIVQPRPVFTTQVSLGSKRLDPEPWKTLLSFVYVFAVFMVTAFVMVIVHDRVPDMQKYPPLPDIFLDNMPYVPWAFAATEYVGMTLALMWIGVLFFHKHRFILLRRMFSLLGTIFLLRCITMLITSLSVPGRHLNCVGKRYGDMWSRMQRTFEIWQGLGMTVQGVSSCGDYMFSGHTSILTILNFFITEYTPALEYYYLHLTSWVLNIFGVFFILAAHEHYSIDVFIAFYLTSRLFMYYHTLANNRSLMQQDAYRTRVWFPLFSFFESKCDGIVPNEYEWPFSHPERWLPETWLPESWTRTRVKNSSPVKDKVE